MSVEKRRNNFLHYNASHRFELSFKKRELIDKKILQFIYNFRYKFLIKFIFKTRSLNIYKYLI